MTTTIPADSPASRAIADRYVQHRAAVDPAAADALGRPSDIVIADLRPEGFEARNDVDVTARGELRGLEDDDRLAAVLADRLDDEIGLYRSGFPTTLVAPLASPAHLLRQAFDDLPTATDQDWQRIARNLEAAAAGYRDYLTTLIWSLDRGLPIAPRQVTGLADQIDSWLGGPDGGYFAGVVRGAPSQLADALQAAAGDTTRAAAEFAHGLRTAVLPRATGPDRVGRERYSVTARSFLGTTVALDELYEFGWHELDRLHTEALAIGTKLTGERTLPEIRAALDQRADGRVRVGPELEQWLQQRIDWTVSQLDGQHFTLPASAGTVEARMATAEAGVMYYSPADPSGTRPGRVWWTVPAGVDSVATWRDVSTLHHEGLPGHHLQFAVTHSLGHLHPWQRYLCELHGYVEGWAHYSEGLAGEVGLIRDEAEQISLLDAQAWRAARIVIDIGLHLDLPIPADQSYTTATRWTPESAAAFLGTVMGAHPRTADFEILRYLAWPGQALSFSVGAKAWRDARTAAADRLGAAFDLRTFHDRALALGPMGLDMLTRFTETEMTDD